MSISYFLLDIYPFGEKTLLTTDMYNQYISYFSYLSDILKGNSSLFYSFSKTMGGDMTGLTSYYLLSPFNFLFIFSNINNLPIIILIVTLLKIGSSGLSMFILLDKENNKINALIFSLIYSMIAYNIVYQQNIMWLDGVIILPLIVLGINTLLNNKNKYIYVLALSLAIITNYYIGFMLCIFSVIYFIGKLLEALILNKKDFNKHYKTNILNFIFSSLLVGGLSSIVLIPTIFSLSGGKAQFDLSILNTSSNFDTIDFATKFFIGAYNNNELISGLPNIYSSLLVIILIFGYFSEKHIHLGKKLVSLITILTLFLSFKISGLNLIWHGFNFPSWFPYRYSFIFSFLLIYIASFSAQYFMEQNKKINKSFFLVFLMFSIIIEKINYEYLSSNKITLTIIFVIIYLILINNKLNFSKNRRYILIILICSLELIANNYLYLKDTSYLPITSYEQYINKNKSILNSLHDKDEFYRIEKTYSLNRNDALLFNYPGLSHYSSSEKTNIKDHIGKLGYRNNGNWAAFSKGSSVAADSFMNIKYILSEEIQLPQYNLLYEKNDIKVYENPFALPFGFMVDSKISNDINYSNPIQYIDDIYSTIGNKENVFKDIQKKDINFSSYNLEESTVDGAVTYSKIDSNDEAFIELLVPVLEDNLITFYFLTDSLDGASLYIDNKYSGKDFDTYTHNVNIAYSENEFVKIKVVLDGEKLKYYDLLFYYQDLNLLNYTSKNIKKDSLTNSKFKGNTISGDFTSTKDKEFLFLNIPYDESWHITVDGTEKKAEKVLDNQMIIKTSVGKHTLKMKYIPKGFKFGSMISFISLFIFILIYLPKLKRN